MLIVYDKKGTIFFAGTGYQEPDGLPFLQVDVPENKIIAGVDVSAEPHKPIFRDREKTQIELMQEKIDAMEQELSAVREANIALISGAEEIINE